MMRNPTARLLALALSVVALGALTATGAATGSASEPGPAAAGPGGGSYVFVVMADSRGGGPADYLNEGALERLVSDASSHAPSFLFFGGDLTYGEPIQLEDEWDAWVDIVGPAFDKIYPVFGGHERPCRGAGACDGIPATQIWAPFGNYFDPADQSVHCQYYDGSHNPPDSTSSGYDHTAYFCDFGPDQQDRFFVLNNDCVPTCDSLTRDDRCETDPPAVHNCVGHELGCAQFNWVREHLVDNDKRYNFFFHHEPAFGVGSHNTKKKGDPDCPATLSRTMDNKWSARNDWARLLGYNNGTIIFSGHEHHYTWRRIDHDFVDLPVNNPGTTPQLNSLAILISVEEAGQEAAAWSVDEEPSMTAELRLHWSGHGWDTYPIASSRDDAEQLSNGLVAIADDDLNLELGRTVGLRWTNITIREGVLENARIRFTASASMNGAGPKVRLRGVATPSAFPFSQCHKDLTNTALRPRTSALVDWQIGEWDAGEEYDSDPITPIIQELIDDHRFGTRFPGEIMEIKTGSAGAPWAQESCSAFMGKVDSALIDLDDYGVPSARQKKCENATTHRCPFHYAVVEVSNAGVQVEVRTWDEVILSPALRVTVTTTGGSSGHVTSGDPPDPPLIYCGTEPDQTDCTHTYSHGDLIQLTAIEGPDSVFDGWGGDCDASGQVTMEGHQSCVARFVPPPRRLDVTTSGAGSGTVTSTPPGLDCGAVCSHDFPLGSVVRLAATPDLGSRFDGWSGDADSDGEVLMDGDKACDAAFDTCVLPIEEILPGQTVSSDEDFKACNILRAGSRDPCPTSNPSASSECPFIIEGAGTDVRFYAGNMVELRSLEVREGTTLEVVIGPPPP